MICHINIFPELQEVEDCLRCQVMNVNTNDYLVKLVDYGFTTTVDKLWSDSADHAGPNWVSKLVLGLQLRNFWRIPFSSQVL